MMNDHATHRDLLLFEERLKTMAISLQRTKLKYQLFLAHLLLLILVLLLQVRLNSPLIPSLLPNARPHPYIAQSLLFVSVTTLILFFASGMYTEKIAYANRYVPHANKALRSFNMYLNVRQPPLRSKFPFNPFAFFFPRPPPPTSSKPPSTPSPSGPVLIPPIPPSTNPRGELIFSSRVDRSFREAYARHRAAFERRRQELERIARARTLLGRFLLFFQPSSSPSSSSPSPSVRSAGPSGTGTPTPTPHSRSLSVSARGRGTSSAISTPIGSRRSSPVPRITSPSA